MQFVADLEPNEDGALQIMYGIDGRRDLTEIDPRRPLRLRRRAAGADRQRRVRPAPERRLRRRPRLDPAPHAEQRAAAAAALADRRDAGGVRDEGLARARPGHLGGPRGAAALRVLEAHVLGRARPRRRSSRQIRGDPSRPRRGARRPRRSAPTSSSTASPTRGVLRQHYETDALDASVLLAAIFGFLPGDDERLHATVARDRRRADRERLRPALPHRRDRRRPLGQGGHVPHLLLLARLRARDRRRAAAGARPDGEAAARSRRRSGLYAEEFDADTGRHLGNFPQAFSHLALIEAAARIIVPELLREILTRRRLSARRTRWTPTT